MTLQRQDNRRVFWYLNKKKKKKKERRLDIIWLTLLVFLWTYFSQINSSD
jgi:hypothetical protein